MAAATDRFIAWCKQEQASIERELELIASGKVRIGEDIGAGWIDKTDEAIERAKRRSPHAFTAHKPRHLLGGATD